ncbi:signal peptide peptidase SppA [Rubrivivax rivuli]|uniref:Signal peptide peptidase SppA n=1 Tax=Rubrivivax rivuli TaxID=1862385 RepID=A0A437RKB9_9BURK|nr:signal peptide peptidase SppA [Rubrivivax rivuli]RVU47226.1 signal peptide peptidase SppA [Rubrivivax rivuli]
MSSFFSALGRGLRGAWWALDFTRRALLNLLLLAVLATLLWLWLRDGPEPLQPKTALVLDLQGRISEQRPESGRGSALRRLEGERDEQTRLRDVLAALKAAERDPAIAHVLLLTDGLQGAGLATLREVAAAMQAVKAAGKPVYAWGSNYDQPSYYLAAHATELWLHPMGGIEIVGYGRTRSYYKDLFEKVGVTAHVIRAGQFKNAAETFSASGPSEQTKEADAALYNALWSTWTGGVEKARQLPAGSVMQAIDSLPDSLAAAGGDLARWAVQRKLVTALKTRDEMRARLIELGEKAEATPDSAAPPTFRQVNWRAYLARQKPETSGDALGIVVAEGGISDGRAGPGRIGGLSTAELIRQAREDKQIKAVVLRVNSPGGSAFGSELVRRELELTRAAGKPVVVSMGDVAASGGYWISLAADELLADPATITGSIGVVAMLPTAEGAFSKLGIRAAGASTTWLGTAYDLRTGLDPRLRTLIQSGVDHIYKDFITRVAQARKTTPEKIDAVAQGRVWAGSQALGHGLVDRLGGLNDAVRVAAARAKLNEGHRVVYVEAPPGRLDRWLQRFGLSETLGPLLSSLQAWQGAAETAAATAALAPLPAAAALPVLQELEALGVQPGAMAAGKRPYSAVLHCLCEVP